MISIHLDKSLQPIFSDGASRATSEGELIERVAKHISRIDSVLQIYRDLTVQLHPCTVFLRNCNSTETAEILIGEIETLLATKRYEQANRKLLARLLKRLKCQ
jgi:hypothetical protein